MDKKIILLVASGIAAVIIAIAMFFVVKSPAPAISPAPTSVPETSSYGTDSPLEKKPDLNPTDKTNPFANVKTNPFE